MDFNPHELTPANAGYQSQSSNIAQQPLDLAVLDPALFVQPTNPVLQETSSYAANLSFGSPDEHVTSSSSTFQASQNTETRTQFPSTSPGVPNAFMPTRNTYEQVQSTEHPFAEQYPTGDYFQQGSDHSAYETSLEFPTTTFTTATPEVIEPAIDHPQTFDPLAFNPRIPSFSATPAVELVKFTFKETSGAKMVVQVAKHTVLSQSVFLHDIFVKSGYKTCPLRVSTCKAGYLLVYWLHHKSFEGAPPEYYCKYDYQLQLVEIWIAANALELSDLQNATLLAIAEEREKSKVMSFNATWYAYQHSPRGCSLRNWMCHQYILRLNPNSIEQFQHPYPSEMLIDIWKHNNQYLDCANPRLTMSRIPITEYFEIPKIGTDSTGLIDTTVLAATQDTPVNDLSSQNVTSDPIVSAGSSATKYQLGKRTLEQLDDGEDTVEKEGHVNKKVSSTPLNRSVQDGNSVAHAAIATSNNAAHAISNDVSSYTSDGFAHMFQPTFPVHPHRANTAFTSRDNIAPSSFNSNGTTSSVGGVQVNSNSQTYISRMSTFTNRESATTSGIFISESGEGNPAGPGRLQKAYSKRYPQTEDANFEKFRVQGSGYLLESNGGRVLSRGELEREFHVSSFGTIGGEKLRGQEESPFGAPDTPDLSGYGSYPGQYESPYPDFE